MASRPDLWARLGQEILAGNILTVQAIDKEIEDWNTFCHAWTHGQGMTVVPDDVAGIAELTAKIMLAYDVRKGGSSRGGVGRNDVVLVVTAHVCGYRVITEEAWQEYSWQRLKKNYKIPLLCRELGVPCLSLREWAGEQGIEI